MSNGTTVVTSQHRSPFTRKFPSSITVQQAKSWLLSKLTEGEICPTCERPAKAHERHLTPSLAYVALLLWLHRGTEWTVLSSFVEDDMGLPRSDEVKLKLWGLIETKDDVVPKSPGEKKEPGVWRLTSRGAAWARNELRLPRTVRVFNDRPYVLFGDPITIAEAMGDRYDYDSVVGQVTQEKAAG